MPPVPTAQHAGTQQSGASHACFIWLKTRVKLKTFGSDYTFLKLRYIYYETDTITVQDVTVLASDMHVCSNCHTSSFHFRRDSAVTSLEDELYAGFTPTDGQPGGKLLPQSSQHLAACQKRSPDRHIRMQMQQNDSYNYNVPPPPNLHTLFATNQEKKKRHSSTL